MIDDDDADFAALASLTTGNSGCGIVVGVLLAILAIIIYIVAAGNKADCAKAKCPDGMHGKLVSHECLCVTAPAAPGK